MKQLFLFLCLPLLARAQTTTDKERFTEPFIARHTVFAGVQVPLNYTVGYRFQPSRRLSVQVQGGLIAAPFDRYTLRTLKTFGLNANLSRIIEQSFRQGSSLSLGVNLHANSPWYAGLFGQYVHFSAGPITPADGLGIYFKQDFSGFGLLNSPAFVFTLQSNWWIGGLRIGRSFTFKESRFGLNTEVSLGKILATRNTFSSNRSLVDGLGVTQRLYSSLDNEIDAKLRRNGLLPTLNALLTYRLH
ncbi:hypothetical protein [Spirosoma utsteinense]|uniref:Outer membrane protein beta-barrel domain-containing protein n=1 Tax=Spirosoma utsteinense TaxID=2585773 RepID=A0ABR6WE86_9BACT|nr:hypothetical protein [Spirosoma utsteinense]MBC3788827.1 hypothetical protein [Spirosoma utsteinense]MBC3794844.1 hypothetical protein [Spirosoma utsteinense]